jgi:hypothetical protein
LQTLIVPAIISLILFLLLTYVIIPVWKRYRARYSQYLPLDSITEQTSSVRQRIGAFFSRYIRPYDWSQNYIGTLHVQNNDANLDGLFDEDEGEELSDVDEHRRLALSLDARRSGGDDDRRLSRDLEEGFRDDSDEEADDTRAARNAAR